MNGFGKSSSLASSVPDTGCKPDDEWPVQLGTAVVEVIRVHQRVEVELILGGARRRTRVNRTSRTVLNPLQRQRAAVDGAAEVNDEMVTVQLAETLLARRRVGGHEELVGKHRRWTFGFAVASVYGASIKNPASKRSSPNSPTRSS